MANKIFCYQQLDLSSHLTHRFFNLISRLISPTSWRKSLPNTERTIGAKGRSFLPLLCCQRRPLEYVPAVFYWLRRHLLAPQIPQHLPPRVQGHQYLTAALSRREGGERERERANFQRHHHRDWRRKKTEICISFCVRVNKSASEARNKEEALLCRKSDGGNHVWFPSSPTESWRVGLENSYHREKMKIQKLLLSNGFFFGPGNNAKANNLL